MTRRVKVGEAWAVRILDDEREPHWLHSEGTVGLDRTVRKLFSSRYNAEAAARRAGVTYAHIVRVTFWRVER